MAVKHVPGVDNVLADGISGWPRCEVAQEGSRYTVGTEWTDIL